MSAVKPPPSLPRGMYWRRGQISVRVSAYGKRHHLGDFDTLTDAKAALQIAKGEIARSIFKPPAQEKAEIKAAREAAEKAKADRSFTVAQWAEQWLANAKRANGTPWTVGTTESYRSHLRAHILPQIGDRPLVEVTREDIDVMLFRVKSAGGSPRHVGTTVRAMFKAAELNRIGGLEHSPVQITTPKAKTAATLAAGDVPSVADVNALAATIYKPLALAVQLACWCALRKGEILGLQRGDVEISADGKTGWLHIQRQLLQKASPPAYGPPKNDSVGTVAIPGPLIPVIQKHLATYVQRQKDAPLFPSPRNPGMPISHSRLGAAYIAACKATGLNWRLHDLRHAGLTAYGQQGATQAEIARRGRHKDMAAAARYQHANAQRDQEVTERMSRMLVAS